MLTAAGVRHLLQGQITAQQTITDTYELTPLAAAILVVGNAAIVAAWLLAARVVCRAACELAGGHYLPVAKLIR